ncbi:GyrI-like domain-containing protein [Haloimpatiens sp. FM7315]|uniref:AraC family transcriptional regulator n=1 Tax=Haloimpatiens sp. FM7315 TaxID=3298609 RepID=UPI0035A2DA38
MNWIRNMNDALNYIEENIENSITLDEIAKEALSSKFHFLRMFHAICGITLSEYIRQRRLSVAAKDVMSSNMKIIDIAYKYGYETPEAFSKAFKNLHGISPSIARKTKVKLKAIPPLSFQITVKGEEKMDYKIVHKNAFKIVGLSKNVSKKNNENFSVIPKFWDEICKLNICEKMIKSASNPALMGTCLNFNEEEETFDYMIAIEGDKIQGVEDYKVVEVPECDWAIFECVGKMPESIQSVWHRIFAEWFPATKYEHACAPEIEYYPQNDSNKNDENYRCEIWIPIIKK